MVPGRARRSPSRYPSSTDRNLPALSRLSVSVRGPTLDVMTTTGFLGGNTDRLRALGTKMSTDAQTLTTMRARTGREVQELAWQGNDRTQFLSQWTGSCAPALAAVEQALVAAAKNLAAQADQQDRTSAASGGTAVPSHGASASAAPAGTAPSSAAPAGTAPAAAPTAAAQAAAPSPAGGAAAVGSAAPGAGGGQIGDLSAQHESGGRSDTVSTGKGDPLGGVSYGKYQIATGTGTAAEFVTWMGKHDAPYAAELKGMTPGSTEFQNAWKGIAARDPEGFAKTQFDFIKATHFDPAMNEVYSRVPGFSLEGRSPVLAETMFSTTVQHRMATDTIIARALAGQDVPSMTDAQIITAIYDERGADNGHKYFPSSPVSTQHSVSARFEREKADALRMLGN